MSEFDGLRKHGKTQHALKTNSWAGASHNVVLVVHVSAWVNACVSMWVCVLRQFSALWAMATMGIAPIKVLHNITKSGFTHVITLPSFIHFKDALRLSMVSLQVPNRTEFSSWILTFSSFSWIIWFVRFVGLLKVINICRKLAQFSCLKNIFLTRSYCNFLCVFIELNWKEKPWVETVRL